MAKVGSLIANRYRVEAIIGEGGMGRVLRVFDPRSERTLALKQLLAPKHDDLRARVTALFQQEFHVLSHIAHPHVVRVFDYGVDGIDPYYTMELLEGQDLRELPRLPWQRVCEILLQLCSALSVLHARRFVHCDLTPRNVVLMPDGNAKLIDFGAMAPVGQRRAPIGTPAYMAPEMVRGMALDPRADLFALGALAYHALTQRHAFPAASVSELERVWKNAPAAPSHVASDIPAALDILVVSLLSLDAQARPINVAELSHRLSAMLGRTLERDQALMHACLTAPSLMGRDQALEQLRVALRRAGSGRGGVQVVRGPAGIGRTRMLDALVLEAKVQGQLVLRADPGGAVATDFTVLRQLLDALQTEVPQLTSTQSLLTEIESFAPRGSTTPDATKQTPAQFEVQQRAANAFIEASAARALVIVVDDLERCDAPSLQVLLHVSNQCRKRALTLALSLATPVNPRVAAKLERVLSIANVIDLDPLTLEQTQALLASMFGETAHLTEVASWIHRVSQGLPALCMQLAEHLVDRGHALYEGCWKLPDDLNRLELPQSIEATLDARLSQLSPAAEALANVLALVVARSPLEVSDYLSLLGDLHSPEAMFAALAELATRQVLTETGDSYAFQQQGLPARLQARMSDHARRDLSSRLAKHYAQRGTRLAGLCGYHHLQAGELDQATEAVAALPSATDAHHAFLRDDEPVELFERTLAHLKSRGASPAQLYPLRKTLLHFASVADHRLTSYADETLACLRRDLGLDLWDQTDATATDAERMMACLGSASARYEATPEAERGLPVGAAIGEMATVVTVLCGPYSSSYDVDNISRLPALVRPLGTLAPVLAMVADVAELASESIKRGTKVTALYRKVVELTRQPVASLDEITREGTHLVTSYYLGLDLAADADSGALPLADALVAHPLYVPMGLQVRRIHALMHGRYKAAEVLRAERDQTVALRATGEQYLRMSLLRESEAADMCGDLLEMGRFATLIETRARKFPGWQPWARVMRARYHLLTGEPEKAQSEAARGLEGMQPLGHGAWITLMAAMAESEILLGNVAHAAELAQQALTTIEDAGIEVYSMDRLRIPLATALAAQGRVDDARAVLTPELARRRAQAPDGVPYAMLCEQLCWIAIGAGDTVEIEQQLAQVARVYRNGGHPGLLAKYERLLHAARRKEAGADGSLGVHVVSQVEAQLMTRLQTEIRGYSFSDQTQRLLQMVLDEAGAERGYFYRAGSDGFARLLASRNVMAPNPILELWFNQYVAGTDALDTIRTEVSDDKESDEAMTGLVRDERGHAYSPFALWDPEGLRVLAVMLIACVDETSTPSVGQPFLNAVTRTLQAIFRDGPSATSLSSTSVALKDAS